jgi:hypothetical protein
MFFCLLAVQCLQIVDGLRAAGFTGTIQTGLYTDILVKPLANTVTGASYNPAPNPGLTQLLSDIQKVKPGAKLDSGIAAAYFAADMFIHAVKTAAKKGKSNITPEAVQKIAANQTWEIKGLAGPTIYPKSTAYQTRACITMLEDTDGTAWNVVEPYSCSSKTFKK